MLSIRIICVGKLKERFYTDAVNEYMKRLAGYCKPEVVEIQEYRLPDKPSGAEIDIALEKESAAIYEKIPGGAAVVALCIEGAEISSLELSERISGYAVNGISKLCFIIGGSFGLHKNIKAAAVLKLSLSKMTFPHNLARVILLEQLYRSFKIAGGELYHK